MIRARVWAAWLDLLVWLGLLAPPRIRINRVNMGRRTVHGMQRELEAATGQKWSAKRIKKGLRAQRRPAEGKPE